MPLPILFAFPKPVKCFHNRLRTKTDNLRRSCPFRVAFLELLILTHSCSNLTRRSECRREAAGGHSITSQPMSYPCPYLPTSSVRIPSQTQTRLAVEMQLPGCFLFEFVSLGIDVGLGNEMP